MSVTSSQPQPLDGLSALVDAELRDIVTSRKVPLYNMMSYHMGWSGARGLADMPLSNKERQHGVLCLLACRASGGPDGSAALPAAAAVELMHNSTQIHDDVQGGSPQRDGRDAVWWIWGPAQAINAGDGMHALARLALFRLLERGVSSQTTFKAVQALDEASLKTCEGRFLDLEAQERIDLSVDAYLKMASAKTGALLACAMQLGAVAASTGEGVQSRLGECGANLGVAMQIRADMRDLWGVAADGQPANTEVLNKKKLLPVVYALEKAKVSDKRRLGDIYFKRVLDPADVVRLRQVLEELGVRDDCEALADKHRSEALAALDTPDILPEGRADIVAYIDSLLR